MRKILLALTLLCAFLFTSCAHAPRGGEFREARDSAFKVRVTMKLDLSPLNEWLAKKEAEKKAREEQRKKDEEQKKKDEEQRKKDAERVEYCKHNPCFGHPMVLLRDDVEVKLSVAQQSTGMSIIKATRDFVEIGWSGTGWAAAQGAGKTYVMTAGHVCESKDVYPFDFFYVDWDTFEFEFVHFDFPIVEKHHVMIGSDGVASPDATIIRDEDLDDNFNGNDLCMLGLVGEIGTPVPVADHDPGFGQACSVVGAPTGLWGGGIAVPSSATFAGRGEVFGTDPDGLAFNGLLAPGNSGSAVICNGEVQGVISLGSTRFPSLIHAVPHERIQDFIAKALHFGK
jgi:hypothetical protein